MMPLPPMHPRCAPVRVRTMRLCTACARVRRSLFMRASRWNTHTYLVLIVTINANSYIPARSYIEDRITDACAHRRRAHVLRACACACGCAVRGPRIRADTCEPLPSGVDCGCVGAQAFRSAWAFNANIDAWNTASVTSLSYVCAAFFTRAARHGRRDALGGVF
jgi:hypothetical protein